MNMAQILFTSSLNVNYNKMAKQKGIVHLAGTLGDLNFYYRKGKPVVRLTGGGFTSKAIRKSPNMVRVRENGSEFGMVSKAKKLVRLGIYPFLTDVSDATLHGRMMKLFQQIKELDIISIRGQRSFQNGLATDAGRLLLQRFDITPQKATEMLPGDGQFDVSSQTYTISNIKLENLRLPKGVTGMQLCLGVAQLDFTAETHKFYKSDAIIVNNSFDGTTLTLTLNSLPTDDGVCLAVLQVRYYQEINGERFLFNDLNVQGLEFVGVW